MKIYSLVHEQVVRASLADTWKYFCDPHNLRHITPPEVNYRVLTPDLPDEMYPGLFIEYRLSPLLGIPLAWVTEISVVEKHVMFADIQHIGPYRIWSHKHFFKREGKFTRMTDRVDYALPRLPFQGLVNSLVVRKKLDEIFAFRRAAVERLFP